jgi:hypothetical protein
MNGLRSCRLQPEGGKHTGAATAATMGIGPRYNGTSPIR